MDLLQKLKTKPIPKKQKPVKISFVAVEGPEIVQELDSSIDVKSFQQLIGKITHAKTPVVVDVKIKTL